MQIDLDNSAMEATQRDSLSPGASLCPKGLNSLMRRRLVCSEELDLFRSCLSAGAVPLARALRRGGVAIKPLQPIWAQCLSAGAVPLARALLRGGAAIKPLQHSAFQRAPYPGRERSDVPAGPSKL
eukprot:15453084-Alexandrium_andersonii.AAC.1